MLSLHASSQNNVLSFLTCCLPV